uniref:Chitin-binding type-2 domain-containing protein n=1 Tax=Strigamia maritima TaxID=126957 RepID=T1J0R0_STRMM
MKNILGTVVITVCLLCVWSQNTQKSVTNLRSRLSRRQAEKSEESERIVKSSGFDEEGVKPDPTDLSSDNSSHIITRRQSERNEISEPIAKGSGASPIAPSLNNQPGGFRQPLGLGPQSTNPSTAYALPSGSEIIVGAIRTSFSCDNRIYGYYADPDNNCQIFHICVPHENLITGFNEVTQYSFFCGNQTIFDQAVLACTYLDDASPCSGASSLYDQVNQRFGITDRPIR